MRYVKYLCIVILIFIFTNCQDKSTSRLNENLSLCNDTELVSVPVKIGKKYGFIDRTGNYLISPRFDGAGPFSEGLAVAKIEGDFNGKWGYIDKTGKYAIKPQFDAAGPFSEGLAAVNIGGDINGKWGFIDKSGKFVIKPQYDSAYQFTDNLAAV